MNSNKFLLGSLIGGVVAFLGGGLLYALLLKGLFESTCPGMVTIQSEEGDIVALIIGNLATGTLLTYILEKWAGIRTWMAGGMAGATVGALMALSFDSMMLGTTKDLFNWSCVLLDVFVSGILWGVSGAAIGWWLGFKRT